MSVAVSEVIELLELYLESAKNNRWGSVGIVLTGHPGIVGCDFAGDVSLELATLNGLALLGKKLNTSIDNWTFPPQDKTLDASFVRYNLANGPLGFDFLVWLIDAEMTRVREGAPAPLKVGFWLGRIPARTGDHDKRHLWLENVFRPCLEFIGAVEDPAALHGRCKEMFLPRDIVAASRRGEKVPLLKTAMTWDGPPDPITITLREANYGTSRNSNIEAWIRFARELQERGETVIVVRDTAKAEEQIPGLLISPRASYDLAKRLALYNAAKINLFVSNGPGGLAIFGDRPWLSFHTIMDGSGEEICNMPEFWEKENGVPVGGQYPWSGPSQRIVWKPDTYDNITEAWKTWAQSP